MAYFAKIKSEANGIVLKVHVVDDADAATEADGIAFLKNRHGQNTIWVQTYKDGTRKNFAGVNCTYDFTKEAFIMPQPHASWTLNESTCVWEAPIARPDVIEVGGKRVGIERWDEELQTWKCFLAEDTTASSPLIWNSSSNTYETS